MNSSTPVETKDQVSESFKAELKALLEKWGAEIVAEDHYPGWPECGQDIRMTATIDGRYDKAGNVTREWTSVDLGGRI